MSFLWLIAGAFIGGYLYSIFMALFMTSGTLRIDHSNPSKDVYRFDIDRFENLSKKRVVLKVDHHADLSQK